MTLLRTNSDGGLEPLGVIDIGSNSVRLVIYEGAVRAPAPLFNEKVLCGLGRSVGSTGHLGEEAVARALAALRRFAAIARILQVKNLRAIATAAVREAKDGPNFIAKGEKLLGTSIQILSGKREAELAAQGIAMGFRRADGIAGDLGGGSLELIDIAEAKLRRGTTLPLGGLRLIDETKGKLGETASFVDKSLKKVDWLSSGKGRKFYAVGGTWRSLAKLHMARVNYPLRIMHGYQLPLDEAIKLCRSVRNAKKLASLAGIEAVSKARRDVLPYGAAVLEGLLEKLRPEKVVFSVFGIREGLVFSLLSPVEQQKDPLLSFCEEHARQRSRSLQQATELCRWTDALFDGEGPQESENERRLRHAACMVSDIGWRAHPDYRSRQSLDVIAHGAVGGIGHAGRVFIAMALFFRHEGLGNIDCGGSDNLPERLCSLLSKHQLKRAKIVGAAIRTAHMISLGQAGVLHETPVSYGEDGLTLSLPDHYADLDGERLRRRFKTLAAQLGKDAIVQVHGHGGFQFD